MFRRWSASVALAALDLREPRFLSFGGRYDYSSDVAAPDLPWAAGQRRPTHIYRHVLRFSSRGV